MSNEGIESKYPLISVVIPVYNTEQYLERCISSVIDNTYQNLEIICIDDGSTDKSVEILKKFAQKDERIRILCKENGGVSSARNIGIKNANGDYISFIDSDDWVHKDFFSILVSVSSKEEFDIIISPHANRTEENCEEKNMEIDYNVRKLGFEESLHYGCVRNMANGRMYKRDCIGENRFPEDVHIGEDMIFNTLVLSNSEIKRIALLENALYYYFNRNNSLSHMHTAETYYELCCWYLKHMELFRRKDLPILQAMRVAFSYRYEGAFEEGASIVNNRIKRQLRQCLKLLKGEKRISWVDKMKFYVCALSPSFYRKVLIHRDKSLIKWEEILREKNKINQDRKR